MAAADNNKLATQFTAMQTLLDVNKLLDERAHDQGLMFTTMDPSLRVKNGLSTGIYSFDLIMGGGLASGRFAYLYGDTGSAKSTTLYHCLLSALNSSIISVFNDHESSVDPTYLGRIGVDLDEVCGQRDKKGKWIVTPKLRYSVGTTAEATFKFMNQTMKGLPDKIQMWDSKSEEFRYFLIHPERNYKPTWMHINKGVKEGQIIEVDDFSPQMVFITDSLKAMLPEAKDEDIDSDPIALQARCFGQNFPLVKSLIGRKNCIYIATNHLNVNPMIKFGCLQAETPIPFVDGRSYPIREVVEKKIEGDVWSYDEANKKFVPAKIVDWHFNGKVEKQDDFITITSEAVDTANGIVSFTCTREHKVLTFEGWKPAEELTTDDLLVTKYESKINKSLKSFMLGTMIGDSRLDTRSPPNGTHHIRFQDKQNLEYVKWKLDKLDMFSFYENKLNQHGDVVPQFVSETRHEFTVWKRRIGNRDPLSVLEEMDDLSLAIWFMDDGSGQFDTHVRGQISIGRFTGDFERLLLLKDGFAKKGIICDFRLSSGSLRFNKDAFLVLCERICKYVPPCMQYKLPPEFRGRYEEFDLDFETCIASDYVRIFSISDGSRRKFRQKGKYDITIEGTHNYLVGNVANGVVVHNSNEVEPGGRAAQYYPDLKLKMHVNRAQNKVIEEACITNEGVDRYIMGKATVIKNKSGPCFRSSEFRIWMDEGSSTGRGIDPVFDIFNFLQMCGLIEQPSKETYGIKLPSWETQKFTWKKFKELILLKEEGAALKSQIEELLSTGKAQELYYQNLAANPSKTSTAAKIEKEDEVIETIEL
jgi:RecA/RadA recombinase